MGRVHYHLHLQRRLCLHRQHRYRLGVRPLQLRHLHHQDTCTGLALLQLPGMKLMAAAAVAVAVAVAAAAAAAVAVAAVAVAVKGHRCQHRVWTFTLG